jgi:hypothetical protein
VLSKRATTLLLFFLTSLGLQLQPAIAAGESEYAKAMISYKKHLYQDAATQFWDSINKGNTSAAPWLHMAESNLAAGNTNDAIKNFHSVVKIYKGTHEASVAEAQLKKLEPNGYRALKDRVSIMAPAPGDPAVSQASIQTIKRAIDALPTFVYNILDDAGTTVTIGPNIIDKWPDGLLTPKPGMEEIMLSQENGRVYDRDIYIYERAVTNPKVSKQLGPPYSQRVMRTNFLYLIGHALDDCMGKLSSLKSFTEEYQEDVKGIPPELRKELNYYLPKPQGAGPGEVVAEIIKIELGGEDWFHGEVPKNFPRTTAWLKAKLHL